MPVLVGRKAPDFCTAAVLGNGEIVGQWKFSEVTKNKYALLVFYPLDFTFVCPTELIALDHRFEALKALNVEVISVSIDSQFSHAAWRNTPVDKGGIGAVKYTMVADVTHSITQSYGVEHPQAGVALRASVLVDKEGVVRAQLVNDLSLGRSIDELVRLVEALQYTEAHGEVCPAGWKKGQAAMKATSDSVASYLAKHSDSL